MEIYSPATLLGTPVQTDSRMGDLRGFEHGVDVGARWAGLSVSETPDLLGFFCTAIFEVYSE